MKVEGLLFDPRSGMYILLLQQVDGAQTLPIWIGKPEADSIALALGKVVTPRPLTHDLIKNIFDAMNVTVTKIVITEIVDNTYYALIQGSDGRREIAVDSGRPMRLRLRCGCRLRFMLRRMCSKSAKPMSWRSGSRISSPKISVR